jgi:hypothetical protein
LKNQVIASRMKSLILVLMMAANAIAYEQIFAVNINGESTVDLDGITYQTDHYYTKYVQLGILRPYLEKKIYLTLVSRADPQKGYDVPLKNDGLYVLIAKIAYNMGATLIEPQTASMTMNDDHKLFSNALREDLCDYQGDESSCDKYFYFCVANNTLYYKEESSQIRNETIRVGISYASMVQYVGGLVVLKGTSGESKKLISSKTNGTLYFDPATTHPMCSQLDSSEVNLES